MDVGAAPSYAVPAPPSPVAEFYNHGTCGALRSVRNKRRIFHNAGFGTLMINVKDEYLHEGKRIAGWAESYSMNFVDRKNRLYGFADINYYPAPHEAEFAWSVFYNDELYSYYNTVDFRPAEGARVLSDRRFTYRIADPPEKFEMKLKGESISLDLSLTGAYPAYIFPAATSADSHAREGEREIQLWERYEQRCRVSGALSILRGERKGQARRFECSGMRKHSWGERFSDRMQCYSWVTVQFRDMSMDLTYFEVGSVPYSQGFISRRSGNIPIMNVELELLAFSREKKTLLSGEFSYRDAQDDRDLIVSRRIHSVDMPLPRGRRARYVRFRAFSEFTVIGTGKKGIGMEEHLISLERLKTLD